MKLSVLRRDPIAMTFAALIFGLVLVAINANWPSAFPVTIAIGGALGVFLVLYEVRLTKRLAQAEFIRDLQSGFASDQSIGFVWDKLLKGEEITAHHRPQVSSYLTFFETLHLLVHKGALDMALTDDLFRNRFFRAVGDQGILSTALVKEAGSFSNIHDLIASWNDHLVKTRGPIHPGYYSYIQALADAKGYEIVRLGKDDLGDLVELQADVLRSLEDDSWLRANSHAMLEECLEHHVTLGAKHDGKLVCAAVLYDGGTTDENIKRYVADRDGQLENAVNLKLVLASPAHRHRGLSRTLIELLEREASARGKTEIYCTIHRRNKPSERLFRRLGYARLKSVSTTYGRRAVYCRRLASIDRRWAR